MARLAASRQRRSDPHERDVVRQSPGERERPDRRTAGGRPGHRVLLPERVGEERDEDEQERLRALLREEGKRP